MARAGCQEPLRREPARGPQHQVKPAASTDLQPESRAGHVAAKAMSAAPQSGGARVGRSRRGMGRSTRARRGRNTRGPSAQPWSRQRGSYKPMAKASACAAGVRGDRSSDEPATKNAGGGKGPCGGQSAEQGRARAWPAGPVPTTPVGVAHRQSAPTATPTLGRGQAIPGTALPRADGPDLEG